MITILLFIALFSLPDGLACFAFLGLVLKFVHWLCGPMQVKMDDYYYSRFRGAEARYERKQVRKAQKYNKRKMNALLEERRRNKYGKKESSYY